MNLIVCTDMHLGISFNHKRQASDRVVLKEILETSDELWILPMSKNLLTTASGNNNKPVLFHLFEAVTELPEDATVFVETGSNQFFDQLLNIADEILMYQWNTTYLYTEQFPDIFRDKRFSIIQNTDMNGFSHEGIHKIRFIRDVTVSDDDLTRAPTNTADPQSILADDVPFMDDAHRNLWFQEMTRLAETTGDTIQHVTECIGPSMFILTGMIYLYPRLKQFIPAQIKPYISWLDFNQLRDQVRMSAGESYMLDLAQSLIWTWGGHSCCLYDLKDTCDDTRMIPLADAAIHWFLTKKSSDFFKNTTSAPSQKGA